MQATSNVPLTKDIYTPEGVAAAVSAFLELCSVEITDCTDRLELRFTAFANGHEPDHCMREFLNYSLQASIKMRGAR